MKELRLRSWDFELGLACLGSLLVLTLFRSKPPMNERSVNEDSLASDGLCQRCDAKFQKMEKILRSTTHELNNYLSVLDGNLHLAEKWAEPGSKVSEVLIEAEEASAKLGFLVSKMRSSLAAVERAC